MSGVETALAVTVFAYALVGVVVASKRLAWRLGRRYRDDAGVLLTFAVEAALWPAALAVSRRG